MPSYSTAHREPYAPEQIFDLVADVERYPEFLPWWRGARVRRRVENVLDVDQVIGRGGINWRFTTKATLVRPERLEIVSTDWPFRRLLMCWRFAAAERGGADVRFSADYELSSALLEKLAAKFLEGCFRRIIGAFERRAQEVYGAPASAAKP